MSKTTVLETMHRLLLEALRHREQEVMRYLVILGPALGGFVWLLKSDTGDGRILTIGAVGVLLLLGLGALYSLALGYNYRYIVLELAKLETVLEVRDAMLAGWPRSKKDFLERYTICRCIPWCTPPEIIKMFWLAFLVGMVGVTITCSIYKPDEPEALIRWLVICVGVVSVLIGLLAPIVFGCKLHNQCKKEPDSWETLSAS